METIDVLVAAIKEFKGAVVLVSHDQYFLSKTATEFWTMHEGRFRMFSNILEAKAFSFPSICHYNPKSSWLINLKEGNVI